MEAVQRRREGGYCRTARNEKAAWRVAPSNGLKTQTKRANLISTTPRLKACQRSTFSKPTLEGGGI
jgi:hypothetical protein